MADAATPTRPYRLSPEDREKYACIYLLGYMINTPRNFQVVPDDDERLLETILMEMMVLKFVEIKEIVEKTKRTGLLGLKKEKITNQYYVPTETGREFLEKFMQRYSEYLSVYDLYCAVDLEAGEFAFTERVNLLDSPEAWNALISEERFSDIRIAVAEYKKLNPVEIVFMSFLNEGRFASDEIGWSADLLTGEIFDQILEICNTSYQWTDFGEEDVIQDIIKQGSHLMFELLKQAEEYDKLAAEEDAAYTNDQYDDDDDIIYYVDPVPVPVYPPGYYDPYYDPYYVSPLWVVPLILLF